MAEILKFPKKELHVQMNFLFKEDSWAMEYIFDHGDTHYSNTFTNLGSDKFDEAVAYMTQVFTQQFCASNDRAG